MRIQHNIMAMNAYRNYTGNTSALSKNLEKLSSGYKINRAGDDAAGLAISEKMRAQITGLDVAQKNAKDGISLVQTAEGALTEVHDMLNRMYELSEQSANGTYDNDTDRANLQKEVVALRSEIDRIANTANFNKIKLFTGGGGKAGPVTDIKGTFGGQAIGAGTTVPAVADVFTTGAIAPVEASESIAAITYTDASGKEQTKEIKFTPGGTNDTDGFTALKTAIENDAELAGLFKVGGDKDGMTLTANTAGAGKGAVTKVEIKSGKATIAAGNTTKAGADETKSFDLSQTAQADDKVTIDGKEYTFKTGSDGQDGKTFKDLDSLKVAAEKNGVTLNTGTATAVTAVKGGNGAAAAGELWLQIGEDGDTQNRLQVNIGKVDTVSLGIDGIDIGSQEGAWAALTNIEAAINTVSSIRGDLGEIQNRLDHTINNLSVMEENIQDAESTIRDTDVADEMMAYTKNNILIQSAQAMLAQANQVPQGVLQLLQ